MTRSGASPTLTLSPARAAGPSADTYFKTLGQDASTAALSIRSGGGGAATGGAMPVTTLGTSGPPAMAATAQSDEDVPDWLAQALERRTTRLKSTMATSSLAATRSPPLSPQPKASGPTTMAQTKTPTSPAAPSPQGKQIQYVPGPHSRRLSASPPSPHSTMLTCLSARLPVTAHRVTLSPGSKPGAPSTPTIPASPASSVSASPLGSPKASPSGQTTPTDRPGSPPPPVKRDAW